MSAIEILTDLYRRGIDVAMADDGINLTVPVGRLTDTQRQMVLAHKPELIQFLLDAQRTTDKLIESAMRACDHHGDNEAARAQMRADVEATPPHLRDDLMQHFEKTYPKAKP